MGIFVLICVIAILLLMLDTKQVRTGNGFCWWVLALSLLVVVLLAVALGWLGLYKLQLSQ